MASNPNKKQINLLRGWPSPHMLPAEALRTAANTVLSNPSVYVPALQYGPDPGYQPLREQLAALLSSFYPSYGPADPDRICITGGASQNIANILASFTDPVYTRAVWVLAPCYFLACPIFADAGFAGRLHAVPEDDLAVLESGLDGFAKDSNDALFKDPGPLRKLYRHVIYCVPTASNPSGKTMSLAHRTALVKLARQHDALIIADDVYDFLQWSITSPTPITPLPRLCDIDRSLGPPKDQVLWFGNAVSNGSFSKLAGPGLRTGWAEAATPAFAHGLAATGATRSGGAPSQLAAAMVCEMLRCDDEGALVKHIDEICRPGLARRYALMMREVRTRLVERFGARVVQEQEQEQQYGGYFIWITFPDGSVTAEEIARVAQEKEALVVAPGSLFEVLGDEAAARFATSVRLCFAWEEEDDLVEGVRRLERVVEALWAKEEDEEATQNKEEDGPIGGHKLGAFY